MCTVFLNFAPKLLRLDSRLQTACVAHRIFFSQLMHKTMQQLNLVLRNFCFQPIYHFKFSMLIHAFQVCLAVGI